MVGAQAPTIEPKPVKQRARKLSGKARLQGKGEGNAESGFFTLERGKPDVLSTTMEKKLLKLVDGVY